MIHDHHADEKESPAQDQQGSTPALGLFQPVAQTAGAPVVDSQPVAPTRGQMREEETNVCCVMQ